MFSLFGFFLGLVIGFAAAILTAIFWPQKWAKITKETGEELPKSK